VETKAIQKFTSGNITSSEGDDQLFSLGAISPGLGHNELVDGLDCALKACELHHGVGDLSAPEWSQRFVKTVDAFLGQDLGECTPEGGGECPRRTGLDSDLARLHGRESNVGKEFS